jgi:hypothetical protein
MQGIIEQYRTGVGDRIRTIVRDVAGRLNANRPAYVYDFKAVDALSPFEPRAALFARSNYLEHFMEMGGEQRVGDVNATARTTGTQVLDAGKDPSVDPRLLGPRG